MKLEKSRSSFTPRRYNYTPANHEIRYPPNHSPKTPSNSPTVNP